LFAFIIGDFLNSGSTYFRQSQEKVLTINGEAVNIQDYQLQIDEMADMYKMQLGTNNLSEEYYTSIQQSVYQTLIQDAILNTEMEKLGMTVNSDELFELIQGENISPMILQNAMFANPETGQFDKVSLLNFLKAIDDDNIALYPPEQQGQLLQAQGYWLFMEKNIKRQRAEEKYTSLLAKAISANKLDALSEFEGTKETVDFTYAMQAFSTVDDADITVNKSEIEKIYNQRKESYKQEDTRVVKYIAVDIVPSSEDYDQVKNTIESLKPEFESAENIADVVNEYSDVQYINAFFSENAFDAEMKQFAVSANAGEIYGPVFENDTYRMFKLVDKTVGPDSAFVSHIMLTGMTEAEMTALADSLVDVLKKGANFGELASEYSRDQSSSNNGELGWFTEALAVRTLNEDFKDVVFSAKLNDISVVKSMYGTHLVKVTERTKNVTKYKVADIEMTVTPSSKTYSDIYNSLNQFISTNNTIAKWDEKASEEGYNLLSDVPVVVSDQMLGLIQNTRQVIRWIFQSEKGQLSDIFEADNKFIVAAVQGSLPEGYRSLASVEQELRTVVLNKKKGEKIVQELKAKNLNTIDSYAAAMNTNVDSVKFVNFATSRITGIGQEPVINGLLATTPVNQLSEPFVGNNGVYVIKPYNVNNEEKVYNEETVVNGINAVNTYTYGFQAIQSLIDNAKIIDNRIRFY
ncbi:peptidylprolyl isomerase, partial [Parabacteroides sp. OttesenSCG-928-G21]|nr:peptidylprolyl isomerase [Parabacteroides sp. OttesenSCG-928-G21]